MSGRKIILAVDDSPVSRDAVAWAAKKLLNPTDEVHIISVLEAANRLEMVAAGESSYPVEPPIDCKPNPLQLERRAEMLKEYKKEIANAAGAKTFKMTTLVSCVGGSHDLGKHICEYAAENNADLLLMGSRGMGASKRAIMGLFGLGSVSDFVVKHAPVGNVLIHQYRGKE